MKIKCFVILTAFTILLWPEKSKALDSPCDFRNFIGTYDVYVDDSDQPIGTISIWWRRDALGARCPYEYTFVNLDGDQTGFDTMCTDHDFCVLRSGFVEITQGHDPNTHGWTDSGKNLSGFIVRQ